ncbi:MAG TPA: lysophospholipid acyltransferase family protein [Tepidisphaeraceae bacterium]|nr:lysophospholipid acyltransferase family protein [Tepidisphaeraceae bacterium]
MPHPNQPEELLEDRPLARALWHLLQFYMRGYHTIRYLTATPLPRQGPAILVANHISGLDPFILQSACPRIITWMMAKEYYDIPSLNWVFKSIGAIPVERSGRDLAATRAAMRALEQGQILGIFPEGRIAATTQIQPLQTGVALVALKTQAPIYPAYLDGSMRQTDMAEAFLYPQHGALSFGPALELAPSDRSRQAIELVTESIHAAMVALQDKHQALMLSPTQYVG